MNLHLDPLLAAREDLVEVVVEPAALANDPLARVARVGDGGQAQVVRPHQGHHLILTHLELIGKEVHHTYTYSHRKP